MHALDPFRTRAGVHSVALAWVLVIMLCPGLGSRAADPTQIEDRGVAATVHPSATQAAINALKQGGNAIDAACAAGLMLGVVDGHNSGIGGGCFIVIRLADGSLVAIDGRETAPAAATRDMFVRDGKADPELSRAGPLASGVPGALAAYDLAVREYGRLNLSELLLPAARVAEEGFRISREYARQIETAADRFESHPAARKIFFNSDNAPKGEGDWLRQTDLAATYRHIAEQGIGWFYEGPFAEKTAAWMKGHGGIMSAEDFRNYRAKFRLPVQSSYQGYKIVGFPPPSSGGVHVAQILNILETFDLKEMEPGSAEMIHRVAEAMKLAFADRAYWLGDPDFAEVPKGLVSDEYASRLADRIDRERVTEVKEHGTPDRAETEVFGGHTTHFSVADGDGNWVACTATINTTFGSKIIIPGTGVVMNNEMDDFSAQPGVPNVFGLVGAEANAVEPGKRPLSSMSPTIVLREGQPIFSVGAAGGPTIISQTVLAILYSLDYGMDLETALAQPRFHHQWKPDRLTVEERMGRETVRQLEMKGHTIHHVRSMGVTQAIARDPETGRFTGAHDPRVDGEARVWKAQGQKE